MYPEHKETRPLAEELPSDAPEEHCSHGVVMQLRTGRFGPFYTSTHECGETKPFARRVGVPCPKDGGEILEKRSKKGKTFYGCGNWPACDWVSWNRPVPEPCPQCGGLQVEMGRGKLRCLKHEGEPKRFARNDKAADSEAADGKVANGKVANGKVANGKVANGKVANGKVAKGKVTGGKATRARAANGRVASSAAKKRKAPAKRAS